MSIVGDFEITKYYTSSSLQNYFGEAEEVTIPSGVTEIAAAVFARNKRLKKAVIPEGVISLGSEVFFECPNLESVTLPTTLKHIGGDCFCRCKKLKEIFIPDGVEDISPGAFLECETLQKANIPTALRALNAGVFMWCYELHAIFIPEGLERIHEKAFFASGDDDLTFTIEKGNKNFEVRKRKLIDVRTGKVLWEPLTPSADGEE